MCVVCHASNVVGTDVACVAQQDGCANMSRGAAARPAPLGLCFVACRSDDENIAAVAPKAAAGRRQSGTDIRRSVQVSASAPAYEALARRPGIRRSARAPYEVACTLRVDGLCVALKHVLPQLWL